MDDVISIRRYFHEFPELSGKEINTSKKIKYELENSILNMNVLETMV